VTLFFLNEKKLLDVSKNRGTLPETNSSHLKMDGWNTIVSFWDGLFSGAMLVSGSVYTIPQNGW